MQSTYNILEEKSGLPELTLGVHLVGGAVAADESVSRRLQPPAGEDVLYTNKQLASCEYMDIFYL
jgi:hypothetical protein